jgi:glycosyltransferase involved in cell wall biosynthesis
VPVISSDRPFNYDVLDDSCAILIDPDSEEELEAAIRRVKEDPALRERLAEGSRRKGAGLSIHRRVDHLLAFMEEQSNHFRK